MSVMSSVERHAYLIAANANLKVVSTCLQMIDDDKNDVFLLLDKKSHISKENIHHLQNVCNRSRVHIMTMVVNWAGYSQVSAVLALLEAAINTNRNYRYYHFLQGSDLPIKTQDEIHSFFAANDGKEFVMIEKKRTDMAINKTQYRHFFCHNRFFRTSKIMKALNFGLVYIQRALGIKKKIGMDVYQGSALFSITDACAKYVLSKRNEIYKKFRFSLAADEVFLQSILMDSPFGQAIKAVEEDVSENARLIDRSRPDGKNSPHIWRSSEFSYIINQPANMCFARKFVETVDYEIVEQIYWHVESRKRI